MTTPPHPFTRNTLCAGRQLRPHRQIIGSDDRYDAEVPVGGQPRHQRASRRHRAMATYRTAADCQRRSAEPAATCRSDACVRPGLGPRDGICPPSSCAAGSTRELAHRTDVLAIRGERAVPGGDAGRSVRDGPCVRTTSSRRVRGLLRHVTDRVPPGRGPARGAPNASRRSVRTRRRDSRCIRFRLLAPQSVCGPVSSVVRRTTERDARPRRALGPAGARAVSPAAGQPTVLSGRVRPSCDTSNATTVTR